MAVAVLDASAFIAYERDEDGAKRVADALGEGCFISTANWAEVLTKIVDLGRDPGECEKTWYDTSVLGNMLEIVSLTPPDAVTIAQLRGPTRSAGLSLGDRACLALAYRLNLPVLTADQAWGRLDLEFNIQLIR